MRASFFIFIITLFTLCEKSEAQDLIPYRKRNKWGFANRKREIVIKPKYQDVGLFGECNLARVKHKKLYGFINTRDSFVIKSQFSSAQDFYNNQSCVIIMKNGRQDRYFINCKNEKINPIATDEIVLNDQILLEIKILHKNDKEGAVLYLNDIRPVLIDSIPIVYNKIVPYVLQSNKLVIVKKEDKWGLVTTKNEIVIPFEFDDISQLYFPNCFVLKKNGLIGLANSHGSIVIHPKYMTFDGEPFHYRDYTKVILTNGKKGYIDLKGTEYFDH